MGRKSTKKDKNIYQLSREKIGYTREKASEKMEFISPDKIANIENGAIARPEEILALAKCYKKPSLCNYYCSHDCAIGEEYVPQIELKELPQIVLETLNSLNLLNKEKERLVQITVDGKISPEEYADFQKIQNLLEQISVTVETLQLWVEQKIADGEIKKVK